MIIPINIRGVVEKTVLLIYLDNIIGIIGISV